MKIVIDIPDKAYKELKRNIPENLNHTPYELIAKSIRKGTPLPKGHGRLIDADNITFSEFFDAGDYAQAMRGIYNAPTIIEADKESEE